MCHSRRNARGRKQGRRRLRREKERKREKREEEKEKRGRECLKADKGYRHFFSFNFFKFLLRSIMASKMY